MGIAGTRALVTGARGFIGSHLVARLAAEGVSVRALVRRAPADPDPTPSVEERLGDVTDPESLRNAVAGCDVVFHCAWGGDSLEQSRRINVQGTRNVIDAAAAAGVRRVVHLSSMAVHGYKLPPTLTENAPLNFHSSAYGISKAEGEVTAFERSRTLGVEVVALRPTLVYGPRAPLFLVEYCERVRDAQIVLIDHGRGLANMLYVDDLVEAMLAAAERPDVSGEAFLISGAQVDTWRTYLGHIARICDKPLPPSISLWRANAECLGHRVLGRLTHRPGRIRVLDLLVMAQYTRVDIGKAQRLLNYSPRISLDTGMRRCEEWLRSQGRLKVAAS